MRTPLALEPVNKNTSPADDELRYVLAMTSETKPAVHQRELDPDLVSLQMHRLIVGGLGAALPPLVYLFAGLRPTAGILNDWALLGAVSSYYHTGAVSIFVGVLFALSLFLFTYRGYREELADRWVARLGGVAGLVVAIVPTESPQNVLAPMWWQPWQGTVHYCAATALFGTLALFCLWLFRKSSIAAASARPLEKRVRNMIFLGCGTFILLCMFLAWRFGRANEPIFWPETGAIEAFALSWLLKSGVHENVLRAFKRLASEPRVGGAPGQ